jgi:TorA maturation chaperone TorD
MQEKWTNRAALYEILALTFLFTKQELVEALVDGEYAEAMREIATLNGIEPAIIDSVVEALIKYQGMDADEVLHMLRREHTRLFVGAPNPTVSPFAGVWWARAQGVEPLLFVNSESMAVERFMRSCGVGQSEGTNEPLDHIGSELEFLQYLCLLRSGVVAPPEDVEIPESAYDDFYREHFIGFAHTFAAATLEQSRIPFYISAARALAALPVLPL